VVVGEAIEAAVVEEVWDLLGCSRSAALVDGVWGAAVVVALDQLVRCPARTESERVGLAGKG
jgi:hypothetical protein